MILITKRKVTAEDIQKFELVSNPRLSPDNEWVIYEQQVADVKEDGYRTQLMLVRRSGGPIRPLTSAGTNNRSARWSPDGSCVAFMSNRAYGDQVWILPMDGGEARQLTRFRYGVKSPRWSPDGKTMYGLVSVEDNEPLKTFAPDISDKEAKEQLENEDQDWAHQTKRMTRLRYKDDGEGLRKNRFHQLVTIDVKTGAWRQLTFGSYDIDTFDVSPDGAFVALISNRRSDPDVEWWHSDVYRIPTSGGELELLAEDLSAIDLAYSPDGHRLAVRAEGEALYHYWSAAHTHLYVMPSAGGALRHLSADFPDTLADTNLTDLVGNVSGVPPTWSRSGRFIYVLSTREGRCEIVRFDTAENGVEPAVVVGGDRDIYGFAYDGDDGLILSYATQTNPGIIAAVHMDTTTLQPRHFRSVTDPMQEQPVPLFPADELRLDDSNQGLFSEIERIQPEAFYYTSADNWQVQGWVIRPVGLKPGQTYPVILEIHGGPQLNYGYAMFHEMQWFAAQGYAVVLTNPRGALSYGQEFANGVRHHYGEGDAADVLHGLDAALKQFDFLDGNRVAVTGGSYGGFMTNWLVGHTDRFFAAVSQRSISNWISFYGVSDIGPLFVEAQHGIHGVEEVEKLWKISPLAYADRVKTPLLLIHSENDLRCPIEQAEQFYTSIKRRGGEVELVRIPDASHGLSRNGKPKLRVARLNAIFHFIDERLPRA